MVNRAAYSLRERVASRVSLLHRVLRDPTERLNQDQNTIIGDMSQPAHGCLEELSDMRGKVIWVGDGRSLSSHQSQEDNEDFNRINIPFCLHERTIIVTSPRFVSSMDSPKMQNKGCSRLQPKRKP
jgi:hypothetical protein